MDKRLELLRGALVAKCQDDGWWSPERGTFDLYEGNVLKDYYNLIVLTIDYRLSQPLEH